MSVTTIAPCIIRPQAERDGYAAEWRLERIGPADVARSVRSARRNGRPAPCEPWAADWKVLTQTWTEQLRAACLLHDLAGHGPGSDPERRAQLLRDQPQPWLLLLKRRGRVVGWTGGLDDPAQAPANQLTSAGLSLEEPVDSFGNPVADRSLERPSGAVSPLLASTFAPETPVTTGELSRRMARWAAQAGCPYPAESFEWALGALDDTPQSPDDPRIGAVADHLIEAPNLQAARPAQPQAERSTECQAADQTLEEARAIIWGTLPQALFGGAGEPGGPTPHPAQDAPWGLGAQLSWAYADYMASWNTLEPDAVTGTSSRALLAAVATLPIERFVGELRRWRTDPTHVDWDWSTVGAKWRLIWQQVKPWRDASQQLQVELLKATHPAGSWRVHRVIHDLEDEVRHWPQIEFTEALNVSGLSSTAKKLWITRMCTEPELLSSEPDTLAPVARTAARHPGLTWRQAAAQTRWAQQGLPEFPELNSLLETPSGPKPPTDTSAQDTQT